MEYDIEKVCISYEGLDHEQVQQIHPFLEDLPIKLSPGYTDKKKLELILTSSEENTFVLDKRHRNQTLICENIQDLDKEKYWVKLSGNNDDGIDLSITGQDSIKLVISSNGDE